TRSVSEASYQTDPLPIELQFRLDADPPSPTDLTSSIRFGHVRELSFTGPLTRLSAPSRTLGDNMKTTFAFASLACLALLVCGCGPGDSVFHAVGFGATPGRYTNTRTNGVIRRSRSTSRPARRPKLNHSPRG